MPRKIKINPTPNPTGLTMTERQIAIEVVQSLRLAAGRLRREQVESRRRMHWLNDKGLTAEQEVECWERACRAALNQFAGRQKTEKGIFELARDQSIDVGDEDMEYVKKSLGMA